MSESEGWWARVWPSVVALLGVLAVVAVMLFFVGRNSPNTPTADSPGAVATGAATGEPTEPAEPEPTGPVTAPPELRAPVRVLNATSVSGLARRTADLLREGGWEIASIGDFSSKESMTVAYYPEGLEEAARALQAQFPDIVEVQPRTGRMRSDQVTLVVGSDWADKHSVESSVADS